MYSWLTQTQFLHQKVEETPARVVIMIQLAHGNKFNTERQKQEERLEFKASLCYCLSLKNKYKQKQTTTTKNPTTTRSA